MNETHTALSRHDAGRTTGAIDLELSRGAGHALVDGERMTFAAGGCRRLHGSLV
jgi:hypothetical protein